MNIYVRCGQLLMYNSLCNTQYEHSYYLQWLAKHKTRAVHIIMIRYDMVYSAYSWNISLRVLNKSGHANVFEILKSKGLVIIFNLPQRNVPIIVLSCWTLNVIELYTSAHSFPECKQEYVLSCMLNQPNFL
jgi:hypothetical protein